MAACQVPDVREDRARALGWIRSFADKASAQGASLVCFPECFLQGYLTDPLLARRHAIGLASDAWASVLAALGPINPILVFGLIESDEARPFNTAVVVQQGQLRGRYRKREILTGERVFDRGEGSPVFNAAGLPFGINICADTQVSGPAADLARKGARLVLCPANNMLPRAAAEAWKNRQNGCRAARARENGVWFISSDVVGEHDGCVSFGPTAVIDPTGRLVAQVPLMEVGIVCVDIPLAGRRVPW